MGLGRYWFQIHWTAPSPEAYGGDVFWLTQFGDMPIVIDVLAMKPKQAIDIARSCHPGLEDCWDVTAYLVGTERQFQEQCEPSGEVNVDMLPF